MNIKHYTYRVTWSSEDEQHMGLCVEFPSLSWLADDPQAALDGIMTIVAEVVNDLKENKENIPAKFAKIIEDKNRVMKAYNRLITEGSNGVRNEDVHDIVMEKVKTRLAKNNQILCKKKEVK